VTSSSATRFGTPARRAGRKNAFANPARPASATITSAESMNGSARKIPHRTTSAEIIRPQRESRSTIDPSANPTKIVGTKAAIISALTQLAEWVLS